MVLAGPGSGKTRILTIKLARMLAEDVRPPRAIACITYSNECVRELAERLDVLGVRDAPNLFVGTIHGFSLRHILHPFAELAGVPVPRPLAVATDHETHAALNAAGLRTLGAGQPYKMGDVQRYRRVHLNRNDKTWLEDPDLARLSEAYEVELRLQGHLDFDDLVLIGHSLVTQHSWIRKVLQAKFPILVIDEYQDLGVALHEMVLTLALTSNGRLLAVGDPDQSVYGFAGARSQLLRNLAARSDVEAVTLRLNYRSAGPIVRASQIVLGEERGYVPHDGSRGATIRFWNCPKGLEEQASRIIHDIIPTAVREQAKRQLGDIAILYRTSKTGTVVADALSAAGIDFIRVDTSPYRRCETTSWIEDCAVWCAGGWREARPSLRGLAQRLVSLGNTQLSAFASKKMVVRLVDFLWSRRDGATSGSDFVTDIRHSLLNEILDRDVDLADQRLEIEHMARALRSGGELADYNIKALGGRGGSPDKINLLTLHSAKGREYDVVIMVGLDTGSFPWKDENSAQLIESRRLFYVGFTRARDEVHMLYSGWVMTPYGRRTWGRSPFVEELEARLNG